ncbi:MAG TPA: polymer-forming cytoskeletal protein [Hyphomicrobium sp.]|nr:polymer-forming cytoskeletal protein [Hyphomicrobium sp.]
MSDNKGVLVIGTDTILQGEVRNCQEIEVFGHVEGNLDAAKVVVHKQGRLFGIVKAENADIQGEAQGDIRVRQLISIRSSGSVAGNVKYGRLAMEEGAELSASVRNVPPSVAGDLDLAVARGRAVRITTADLTAIDPDDQAKNLTFSVSNTSNGFISLAGAPSQPVTSFTQYDLEGGRVLFCHDGSSGEIAKFDVVVADKSGATSGVPQSVRVAVRA